jgi:hypothetical protein
LSRLLGDLLDDTDGDGLFHVSDGESTERRVLGEDFAAHGFGGNHVDHASSAGFDVLGEFFLDLTGSSVHAAEDFLELASNVGSVAIQHGGVTVLDLTGVVHDDDLGLEALDFTGGVVLGIGGDITSLDVLDGETLDVESDVVTGGGLGHLFVMHFDGFDISGKSSGGESDVHVGLDDTGFDTSDGDRTDTADLVNVLEGETEGLVEGSFGGLNGVQGFNEAGSLVPGGFLGLLEHIVTVETGDGDEGDFGHGPSGLLEEVGKLDLDFFVSFFIDKRPSYCSRRSFV